ncbi:centromere-associated protein E [Musca vetustissima]|uniref:centromere-associated protein E n=1 Tax=Musca vetustissima TaxID=27455 RepID=UPI002AB76A49|nr:centromere-associated protein E [Musca vetustissima]
MDMRSWKKVLLQWVTECGFMERNYFNIEQSDIDAFYHNFSLQHPRTANNDKCKKISDFLKEFYPKFEVHLDDENCLSSSDYIYLYSLFLHFCCVKHPQTVFHEICQRLPEFAQQCIASFFKELLETEPITKEALRHAIAEVVTTHVSPPRLNDSISSNQSALSILGGIGAGGVGGAASISSSITSPSFSRCDSPLKTPKRCAGPQRISPTTPKSYLLEERQRELYNLRAQLETERYEKGLLEVQIKQNEDKILKLNQDHKKLQHQIQDLKNDILLKTSDGTNASNREGHVEQIHKRLLKEMTLKENEIIKLNDVVGKLREEKALVQEKLSYAQKQIAICMNRIKELDYKVDELSDTIEKRDGTIKYLTDSKLELEQYIAEYRSANMHSDLNGSMECFDSSFARNIGNTNASSNVSSPENLGASVIDIQLREKEHENSKLKEELELVKDEHKRLAKSLQDLAEKQAKEFDIVWEHHSELADESQPDVDSILSDPLEQFSLFTSCMEKISSFHKIEKNKIQELEEEGKKLQNENADLTLKLESLNQEVMELKTNVTEVQKNNEQLLKDKEMLVDSERKQQMELEQLMTQKQQLSTELQEVIASKNLLDEDLAKTKQETEDMKKKTAAMQEDFMKKSQEFELQIQELLQQLNKQNEELKNQQLTETSLKVNYEQLVIENEELKNKSHNADKHLSEMKHDLEEKQQEISKLAEKISQFSEKNSELEKKINALLDECEKEKLAYKSGRDEIKSLEQQLETLQKEKDIEISNLEKEMDVLKERNANIENDFDNLQKHHEEKLQLCQEDNEKLQNQIIVLQQEREEEKSVLETKQKEELQILEEQVTSLELEKQDLLNKIELQTNEQMDNENKHKQEIQTLEEQIKSLTCEKDNLEKNIRDISGNCKDHEHIIAKLNEENQQEKLEQDVLKEKLIVLETTLNDMQNNTIQLKEQIENLKEEKLKQQLDFESLQTQHHEEVKTLGDNFNKLQMEKQNEIQNLLKEISVQKEKYETLEKDQQQAEAIKLQQQENLMKMETKLQELHSSLNETKDELLHSQQNHKEMEKLTNMDKKEKDFNQQLEQATQEYEASLERIRHELTLEKEHYETKEKELLMVIGQHNDVKKQLIEKESEITKLMATLEALQEQNQKLKLYETRVSECSMENNKLQEEIDSFKHEVHQNALRLVEADKALNELLDLTKEHESNKQQILKLQSELKEKQNTLDSQLEVQEDLEQQVKQQSEAISKLSETLKKIENLKENLDQQLHKEQEEKTLLLESLEKSTDQLKSLQEEQQQQKSSWEEKFIDLKQQMDELTLQNTKLQGDLVERDAELRMSLEDHEQERDSFHEELSQVKQKLQLANEQLEQFDMSLMEILAIMENNFNLKRDFEMQSSIKNTFNVRAGDDKEQKINQLRGNLNIIFHLDQQQRTEHNETLNALKSIEKSNVALQTTIAKHEKNLQELREQLENEEQIAEKRMSHEVKRLEEDLHNLEQINERLTNGNFELQETIGQQEKDLEQAKAAIQKLEQEKQNLQSNVNDKSQQIEKLQQQEQSLQQQLKDKSQQIEKVLETSKLLEQQIEEKSQKLQSLNKEYQDLKDTTLKQQQQLIEELQEQLSSLQAEQLKLNDKVKQLHNTNDALETEVSNKTKELLTLNNKSDELLQSLQNVEQQLQLTTKKLDETEALKLNSESNYQQIQSEAQQLKRDMDFLKAQQQSAVEENQRLNNEIESLKQDKQHLREEIRDTKTDLQRANDNVTQLIQQIASIRMEKESVVEENTLMRKQLEESGKHHSSSENKLKSIIEKSQECERKLLTTENELKSTKASLEKCELSNQKLSTENAKLKDSQESSTKRIEKLALKLGDSQAKSTKLERDNEKLSKALEAHSTTVEALQKEKDVLQNEAKALKERLSRAERAHEQLAAKVQNLELLNSQLQETKQKLEASEVDGKSKLNKMDKMRISNEEKIRKLANSLNNAENTNVKLNLEIGSLNSQLQKLKALNNQEQVQDLTHKLELAQHQCQQLEDLNEKLQQEVDHLKEDKTNLTDQLSKLTLTLQITRNELEEIRSELLVIRDEKSRVIVEHETSTLKLRDLETQNDNLLHERKNLVTTLESRIASLEEQLSTKCKEVDNLQHEIQTLRESSETNSSLLLQQHSAVNHSELEQLRERLSTADDALQKEQQIVAQLRLDNQILHTKYQESKQRVLDATKNSEERIKENRLELEGKLEKMKNKMKTLYTEEITKMKTKQEREVANIKSEMEVLKAQNSKYEEHTRKLSNQIVRLNDNILEYQKENTILSTKLKHLLEHHESEKFKRPNSIHVSTISSSTGSTGASNTGTNLAMEDEEGEVFNNTYLTDLKTGRMSEFMSREVCTEELKYRNSLLPPHLRSSYAAQYDSEIAEDELKDGPHSFDDSMSALLSTTNGGNRKKCTGVTHYKRPGPPTPSKNGRLSFGGCGSSEPMREILKESFDSANSGATGTVSSSSAKTPARFNFFASRFSMGNGKDEVSFKHPVPPKKEIVIKQTKPIAAKPLATAIPKKPPLQTTAKAAIPRHLLGGVVCTSTPRKSKVHYDQRRLLDQLLTSSPSPSPLAAAMDNKHLKLKKKPITPPDVSFIETPLSSLMKPNGGEPPKAPTRKQTAAKRIEAIAAGLKNKRRNSSIYGRRLSRRLQEICTPTSGETTSSAFSNTPQDLKKRRQTISSATTTTSGGVSNVTVVLQKRCLKKKPQKERNGRPSLCLKSNIFAKQHRTPNKGVLHDLNRYKSRRQRFDRFNRGRDVTQHDSSDEEEEEDVREEEVEMKFVPKNITYEIKPFGSLYKPPKLGETVVITKLEKEDDLVGEQFENTAEDEESFLCASEVFDTQDAVDWQATNDSDRICQYNSSSDEPEEEEENEHKFLTNNIKCERRSIAMQKECKKELVTSLDLEEFDRYVSDLAKVKKEPESYSSAGSSQQFEKLVLETQSNAPFEVKHIKFNISGNSTTHHHGGKHQQQYTFASNSTQHSSNISSPQHDDDFMLPEHCELMATKASPHYSPTNQQNNPANLSRIIYGGTVIYNRRLPNINTTYVRKSSIYVKNKKSNATTTTMSDSNADVILITNQTITAADLARMWKQMDSSARLIVSFAALASFTTVLGLFLSFYSTKH